MDDAATSLPDPGEEAPEALQPLARLEERILATVGELRAAREAKARAESESAEGREKLARAQQENRQLRAEAEALRKERRQILERVERLLAQVEKLPAA